MQIVSFACYSHNDPWLLDKYPTATTQIRVNTHHERTGFAYVKTKVQISCAARLCCRYQIVQFLFFQILNFKLLAFFYRRTGRFVSDQVRNHKDWFSHIADHFISSLIRVLFFFSFFFLFQFYVPFKIISTHMRRAKTGKPREKTPGTPASRTWLVSHVASAGLKPTPDTAVR